MRPAIQQEQHQGFFVRGPAPFARLIMFATVSLLLMATDSRLHYLTQIRQAFVMMLYPIETIAYAPVNAYLNTQAFLTSHQRLIHDNQTYRETVLKQSADLQRLKSLEAENANLRELLGAAKSTTQSAKLGEISHMGRDPFVRKIEINLGSHHGIEAGQAAIDALGVVGQVTRVYPYSSEVTLITDKELAIPVQVERNGLRAIAFGHGQDATIDLPYLPANVDIRKGDKLVTSGIDGIYPTGLAVAEVAEIKTNANSPFAQITCKPIAGIDNHRQILLLSVQAPATPPADVHANADVHTTPQVKNSAQKSEHAAPNKATNADSHGGTPSENPKPASVATPIVPVTPLAPVTGLTPAANAPVVDTSKALEAPTKPTNPSVKPTNPSTAASNQTVSKPHTQKQEVPYAESSAVSNVRPATAKTSTEKSKPVPTKPHAGERH